MTTLALLALMGASPLKLAMPGFSATGIEARTAGVYADFFAQRLGAGDNVRVMAESDLAALVGLERQKELLGCTDKTNCIAELAAALNVEGVVVGSLGKVGGGFVVTIKVVAASDGHIIADASTRVGSESALLDWLGRLGPLMASRVFDALGPDHVPGTVHLDPGPPPVNGVRLGGWVLSATGLAAAITGGVLIGLAAQRASAVQHGVGIYGNVGQLDAAVNEGKSFQTAGWVLLPAGVAVLVTGVVMLLLGNDAPAVAFAPATNGFALVGTW